MPEPSPSTFLCPRCRASYADPTPCVHDGSPTLRDRSGQLIAGRYRFRRPLGRGGMGVIWEAEQVPLLRRVAVKLMPMRDEETVRRFRRGAVVMAKMAHPNIVDVHDLGEFEGPDGPELYLVMERLHGATLKTMTANDPLRIDQAMSAASQTLVALEHVHRRGYIHRDVKPANLFVTAVDDDPFVVKLLDFGIARLADNVGAADDVVAAERERAMRVTQPLRILGTPEYMAPEQILGAPLDPRVDLYAVGVMFFHLLIGRLPFHGDKHQLYHSHLREEAPSIGQWLQGSDRELDQWRDFFTRALAKSPDGRHASAMEMREALLALPRVSLADGRH